MLVALRMRTNNHWLMSCLAAVAVSSTAPAGTPSEDLLGLLERRVRIQSPTLGPGWHEGLFNRQRKEPPCFVVITWKPRISPDAPIREESIVLLRDVVQLQAFAGPNLPLQVWAGRPSAEACDESLWQPVSEITLDANRDCEKSGPSTDSDRPVLETDTGTWDPPAGLEFLRTVPELRGVSLKMDEGEFQDLVRSRSLSVEIDRSGGQTAYWVQTSTGENVIVMFRDGACTGIQRMPPAIWAAVDGWQSVRVPLLEDSRIVSRDISADLQLRLIPLPHARVDHFGWTVGIFHKPVTPESDNLLYHSRYFHGPYPTDVLAWITAAKYFPDDRVLPVYGHPWEIRIRILNGATEALANEAHFISGELQVGWRKLPQPNPPTE